MPAEPKQPHDRIFRHSMSLPRVAREFLEAWLPPKFLALVDWNTLAIQKVSGLDNSLKEHREDVVYRIMAAGRPVCFYLLIEHQSRPSYDMPLRCLEYTIPLWRKERAGKGSQKKLPLVIPVVVHPGPGKWPSARRLRDLIEIPEEIAVWAKKFVPDCGYLLAELAGHPMEKLASGSLGQAVMAALQAERRGKLGYGQVRKIIATLFTGGDSPDVTFLSRQLWTYLLHHSELKNSEIEEIVATTIPTTRKRKFMSTAQRLKLEGRQEGRQEGEWIGKIELLEQMLGNQPTSKKLLEAAPLAKLKARFHKLEEEYHRRFR